ncbi:MAG TPA: response regulator, partial [Chthoniobacteraceae bacterium]|nr:response regulator [Chthoniobacteraceae bacterium]
MISHRSAAEIKADERVNILVVDDRPDKLLALEAVLTDLGENIVRASSGKEALRCLLQQDFAVILLDVNMPGMDGFETATLIRKRPRSELTPIIFVSAVNDNE